MSQKTFYYLAGLPRTGSTVLGEILNQNDKFHVSPASPLSEIIGEIIGKWRRNEVTLKAYKHSEQLPNLWRAVREGMYQHRDEPNIIDKSWAWQMNSAIDSARQILGEEIKVICPVDNIADCLASFIMLIRSNPDYQSFIDVQLRNENRKLSDENRCLTLMNPRIPTSVGWCYENLKSTWAGKNRKNLLLIERKALIDDPQNILDKIYDFLECKDFAAWGNNQTHYFDEIKKEITEDDGAAYGIPDLHKLSPKLRGRSWEARDVLGNSLFYKYKRMEFWRDLPKGRKNRRR